MTAKQILDAFSETLMQDERILTPRERELLMSLLQNSKTASTNPEIQSAVADAIARGVGETVAQRAFALLGGSIVEQILAGSGLSEEGGARLANKSPSPGKHEPVKTPSPPGPQPPGVKRPPMKDMPPGPQPPGAPQGLRPQTVEASRRAERVGVLDVPDTRTKCVVLDEFLAPQELEELISYTLQRESEFQKSTVISPSGDADQIDYGHRCSRVLMDLGKHESVMLKRIETVLPRVLDQLGLAEFPVIHTEAQITASNDGDFFGAHWDNSQEMIASRQLTFVYFFHREPRQFEGGDLRLYDSQHFPPAGSYQTITPQQNQIVFFPCSVLHEITPVECPSRAFADSRFTLNGWLHQ